MEGVITLKNKCFLILATFNLLFYLAMKSIWSGIEGIFGVSWLQYLLLGLLVVGALLALFLRLKNTQGALPWIVEGFALLLLGGLGYMFYLGIGSLRYILRSFLINMGLLAGVLLMGFFLFRYPKTKLASSRGFRNTLIALIGSGVLAFMFLANVVFLSAKPVVYAVEDTYQIVWTTSIDATGVVKVGEDSYPDLYQGSQDSFTRIHKVEVPMAVLDAAGKYEISSTNYIYRGPYSGLAGRTVKASYDFRPLDPDDGLQIYSLSDTHEYVSAATNCGTYFGDDLDLLVLAGDIASHLEMQSDMDLILTIAHNITLGKRPVVYARGNHEVKGDVANKLFQVTGSANDALYYTFCLGPVYGIVLDLGEDHPDDWWEYYGTAHFDEYRNEQTAFLNQVLAEKDFQDPGVEFILAICHMPITYVSSHDGGTTEASLFLGELQREWTGLLNEMGVDLLISGHHHQLFQFLPDMTPYETLIFHENYQSSTDPKGYMSDADFPTFIVSRRSDVQDPKVKENLFGRKLTGLATEIDLDSKTMTHVYTNTLQEIVPIIRPFTGESVTTFALSFADLEDDE